MTGHMWDGQWVLANGKMWAGMPKDLQTIISKNVIEAVVKQREDMAKLNDTVEADLKSKGLVFNSPDKVTVPRRADQGRFLRRVEDQVRA